LIWTKKKKKRMASKKRTMNNKAKGRKSIKAPLNTSRIR
jgi:hypothetical protein